MKRALDTKNVDLVKEVLSSCTSKEVLQEFGTKTILDFAFERTWTTGAIAVMKFVHPEGWFVPVHNKRTTRSLLFQCFWNNDTALACALRDWRSPDGHAVDPANMDEGGLRATASDETASEAGNLPLLEIFIQWVRPNGLSLDIRDEKGGLLIDAATCRNPDMLKRVLEWRAVVHADAPVAYMDASWNDDTALVEAVRWGRPQNVETLLRWVGPQGEKVNPQAWAGSGKPFVAGISPETVSATQEVLRNHGG